MSSLLLESGDVLLLESGDALLLEGEDVVVTPSAPIAMRTADVWFQLNLAKYPATEGTTIYRFSKKPFADAGAFKEGRLISISKARRAATDINGNYNFGRVSILIEDEDGFFRGLLEQGTATEYFVNREGTIYLLSEEGRKAGLDPRIVFRGWVSDVQTTKSRKVRIDLADVVGSQFCGFNLDKTIPTIKLSDLGTVIDALKEKVLPIYAGEHSDFGALDVNGNPAERGLVPGFDVGMIDVSDPDADPTPGYTPPPVIVAATVVGSGDQTYEYSSTVITPYGESLPGNTVTVTGAPATSVMDISNYVAISGTYEPGVLGTNIVRILGRHGTSTWLDDAFLDNVTGEFWYNDGAHPAPTPIRADVDIEKTYTGPPVPGSIEGDTLWNIIAICLGYGYDILDVFGSDLADGTEPRRISLMDFDGVDILTPNHPDWPFPNPWIERNGITFTGFLARGPRLAHHKEGAVTFAANICGPHDGGSPDAVINQAFPQLLWLLNEHVAKNNGTGYRTGTYWPLATYENGDSLFETNKFYEKQAITADWLGTDLGYLSSIFLTEPTTVREIVRRFCLTFGAKLAHNHWGQVFPMLIAAPDDPTVGRHLRDRIEIVSIGEPVLAHDEVKNLFVYNYHWDPDANDFRNKNLKYSTETSIAAHIPGGVVGSSDRRGVKQDDRNLYYTNDEDTATDVIQREAARRARRPRYVPVVVKYMGLELDIDTPVRLTHYEGLGTSGDVAMPGIVLEHETDTDREEVELRIQDLRTLE